MLQFVPCMHTLRILVVLLCDALCSPVAGLHALLRRSCIGGRKVTCCSSITQGQHQTARQLQQQHMSPSQLQQQYRTVSSS
jgi:hypothetical protein